MWLTRVESLSTCKTIVMLVFTLGLMSIVGVHVISSFEILPQWRCAVQISGNHCTHTAFFFANEHSNCVFVNAKIQFMCNKIMIEITLNLLHTQNTSLNSTLLSNARFMELNVFLDFISFLFTSPVSGLCMPSAAVATTKNLRTKNRSWFCELKGLSSFCACQLFWLAHFFAKCFWNWEQREANVISRNNNQEKKNYCHASSDREIWTESLLFFFVHAIHFDNVFAHRFWLLLSGASVMKILKISQIFAHASTDDL